MSTTTEVPPAPIRLSGRLSFPQLYQPKSMNDDGTGKAKYSATLLMDKKVDAASIAKLRGAIAIAMKSPKLKGRTPKADKSCLRDGSEKTHLAGYSADVMFFTARNERKPKVVDQKLQDLLEGSPIPYAGCYVNMTVDVYGYIHPKSGPGITASLRAVQFVRNGEAFGGGAPVDAETEFEEVEDESSVV